MECKKQKEQEIVTLVEIHDFERLYVMWLKKIWFGRDLKVYIYTWFVIILVLYMRQQN